MTVEWIQRSETPDVVCVVNSESERVARFVKEPKEIRDKLAFAEVLIVDAYRAMKDFKDGRPLLIDGEEFGVDEYLADFRKDAKRELGIEVESWPTAET